MEKIVALISAAILLGVLVMLIPVPIAIYMQSSITAGYDQMNLPPENTSAATRTRTFLEEAQTYGKVDIETTPLSQNLSATVLVVATGFVVAAAASVLFKRKTKETLWAS